MNTIAVINYAQEMGFSTRASVQDNGTSFVLKYPDGRISMAYDKALWSYLLIA